MDLKLIHNLARAIKSTGQSDAAKIIRDAANEIQRLRKSNNEITRRYEQIMKELDECRALRDRMRVALKAWLSCGIWVIPNCSSNVEQATRLTKDVLREWVRD